jgi:formylglycine-generating enzyme required for sulfatase activity
MTYVFISYSKKNKAYAQALKSHLLTAGFDVWMDDVIEPSDNWWEAIVSAIDGCAACLVIMTHESKASKWVQREVALVEQQDKPVFPLLLTGSNWPLFVLTQFEDVQTGGLPPDRFLNKLARHASRRTAPGADVVDTAPAPIPIAKRPVIKPLKPKLLRVEDILPPPFEWCPIPKGFVTLEDASAIGGAKGGKYEVAAFDMAKYPVTNAQYQVFVDAFDGYGDPGWWDYSEAAKAWRKQNAQPRKTEFPGDDLPRTNVCWYEAVAFCRWLSAQTDEKVMLPTEQQWQRAAQGDDNRTYPWGKQKPNKDLCNWNNEVGQTTPVTRYLKGASPYGVMDMSGNVWEWCLTAWETGEAALDGTDVRWLRGGSWGNDDSDYVRAAVRGWNGPDLRNDLWGFRLARSNA